MILAIDMGNTNTVIGGIDEERTYFIERVTTDQGRTDTEYNSINSYALLKISYRFNLFGGKPQHPAGVRRGDDGPMMGPPGGRPPMGHPGGRPF